jgi:hypothetical protein
MNALLKDVVLYDPQKKQDIILTSLWEKQPVVIMFFRRFGLVKSHWCAKFSILYFK